MTDKLNPTTSLDIHDKMILIPQYEGKYYLDTSYEPYRIWSRRRAGCKGMHINIEMYGRRRFARLLNKHGISELKPVSDISWTAFHPETNLKENKVCFEDNDISNDNIMNLFINPLYNRDQSGNVIVNFD